MLSKMFLAGAQNLENKKEWINELNVFPVPDGDTGTNMSMTIMAAAKEVASIENPNMESLAKAISSGSLRGARGNSGVILSQLFRGFAKIIKEYDEINTAILASACDKAVETAYKAVMKPKEGTILTVAKGAAKRASDLAMAGEKDLEKFIAEVIKEAEVVLSKTPDMLPVLKQAGVVDSGGQGLVEVLKGAYDAFLGKEIEINIEATSKPSTSGKTGLNSSIEAQANAEIKFCYCTQFLIMLKKPFNIKHEMDFKEYLESIGDSIVVVADDEIVKVHVHTNDPGLAMQKALLYGSLTTQAQSGITTYAGINTKSAITSDHFTEKTEPIIFFAGAPSKSEINEAAFYVTDEGSLYASKGRFEGAVITNGSIEGSVIRTAKVYGTETNGAALSIYDTAQGIAFKTTAGLEENEVTTLQINSASFSAHDRDFITIDAEHNIFFSGQGLTVEDLSISNNQILHTTSAKTCFTGNSIMFNMESANLEDCAFEVGGSRITSKVPVSFYQELTLGETGEKNLIYKPSSSGNGYDLYVQ